MMDLLPPRLVGLLRQGALCARREGNSLAKSLSPNPQRRSVRARLCQAQSQGRGADTRARRQRDGQIAVINEYLDEVFPDVSLKPKDPQSRAVMQVWTKAVDEDVHPACAEVTFSACLRHVVKRLPPAEYEKFLNSTPSQSVTPQWHQRKKQLVPNPGFDTPGLAEKYRLYNSYLGKREETLGHRKWLAGDTFSLADIAMTPYVNRLDMLGMSHMWEKRRSRLRDWFERIKARPAFKPALLDWCPPDLTADLLAYGRQSWPSVERLLAQES